MRLFACLFASVALAAAAAPMPAAPVPAAPKAAVRPRVVFTTSLGNFTVELDAKAAPRTVANFMAYVKAGQYKGTLFHRVIARFMVQGGGFTTAMVEKPTGKPIVNEARLAAEQGLKNVRGTIAMARTSDPDSATAQFFINVVDNAFLDYPGRDGAGYCPFGKVVAGQDTVDKIAAVATGAEDVPKQPVVILDAKVAGKG